MGLVDEGEGGWSRLCDVIMEDSNEMHACCLTAVRFDFNSFLPTVSTFAVRETAVSRRNGSLPHYAERRQSLGQQMLEWWA